MDVLGLGAGVHRGRGQGGGSWQCQALRCWGAGRRDTNCEEWPRGWGCIATFVCAAGDACLLAGVDSWRRSTCGSGSREHGFRRDR